MSSESRPVGCSGCSVLNERAAVDMLLFPVKLGPQRRPGGWLALLGSGVLLAACGYHSVAETPASERLCVRAAPSKVPYPAAPAAALDGARRELARYGALRDSNDYPCLLLELLRVDEVAVGATAELTASGEQPRARGASIGVLARGWVATGADAPVSRDTGDMRRTVELEVASGVADSTRHDRAVVAAAERVGRDIARVTLGLPAAADGP
jgi:hypothetical protein